VSSLRRWLQIFFRTAPAIPAHSLSELYSKIDFKRFESELQYRIRTKSLFCQAVLHRSYLQFAETPEIHSNERLEFLGDSILNMVVAERLYLQYPDAEEGDLTIMRARLVNRKALVYYAKKIHLRDFLLLSNSASQTAEKGADTILSDAYEAVIGAVYLDGGLDAAKRFVERQLTSVLKEGTLQEADENYKSALLEYAQANSRPLPHYTILKEEGPDHDRTFTVEVFVGDGMTGVGMGKNKKEAEQAAAQHALSQMGQPQPAAKEHSAS
jgi:ribonuclease III